jgi:GH24 family phage-related lysozyme (muramidase)
MPIAPDHFLRIWGDGHSYDRVINPETFQFIREKEQFRSMWYEDGLCRDGVTPRYSIAFGHAEEGDNWPFKRSDTTSVTLAQAEEILLKDVEIKARYINKVVTVPLTTFQYGALVSLCYQQGQGRLTENPILINWLNKREYVIAGTMFLNYNRNGKGEYKDGLLLRRAAEIGLFMTRRD